jgi:hypothetical protein
VIDGTSLAYHLDPVNMHSFPFLELLDITTDGAYEIYMGETFASCRFVCGLKVCDPYEARFSEVSWVLCRSAKLIPDHSFVASFRISHTGL